MRDEALGLAALDRPDLDTLDVGAGTGFCTEGIVARVAAERVTMIDQSPHQLARARRKPALARCAKRLGDAEALDVPTDSVDRYVSAGSIEYWPDPQRGVAEAYRVLRPGGLALLVGPVRPRHRVARWLADVWMLFPGEHEYRALFERAGFRDVTAIRLAPAWYTGREAYAVAVAGTKPAPGPSPVALGPGLEELQARMTAARRLLLAGRLAVGGLAGLAFVPLAAVLTLRARVRGRLRGGGA